MIHIIAFMGKVESGKTAAEKLVRENYDNGSVAVVSYAFATPLKKACFNILNTAFGVPEHAFFGTKAEKETDLKEYGLPEQSGRTILQFIGTEGFRTIHPDVWVSYLRNLLVHMEEDLVTTSDECDEVVAVISDLRFLNEAKAIQAMGGSVVKLLRHSDQKKNQGILGHQSEMEQDRIKPDYTIDNRSTSLAQFEKDVLSVVEQIVKINRTAAIDKGRRQLAKENGNQDG